MLPPRLNTKRFKSPLPKRLGFLSRYGHVTRCKSMLKHVNGCKVEVLCNGGKL
jgi:hypothetical protein